MGTKTVVIDVRPLRAWLGVLCGGMGLLAAGCAAFNPAPRGTVLAAARVDLPTAYKGGFLFVDARINGTGPFRLLVDTGTSGLALSAAVAETAGLPPKGSAVVVSPAAKIPTRLVSVDRFECGGMTLQNTPAVIIDAHEMEVLTTAFGDAFGCVGIVGIGVFQDVIVQMDFPGRGVSVFRPDAGSFSAHPFVSYAGIIPRITLEMGGRSVQAIVDTGSGFHLIIPELESYPLAISITLDQGAGGMALGSSAPDREENSQLKGDARWGPVVWRNPPLRRQTKDSMGNVGVRVLDQLCVAFDPTAHRIYFVNGPLERSWPISLADAR